MSSAKTIVKNAIFMYGSEVFGNIFSLFFIIFTVRILGAVEFGKYSFAFAFIGTLIIFCDFGISSFIVREISRNKNLTKKYFGNGLSLKIIFLLFTCLLSVVIINLTETSSVVILAVYLATAATLIINLAFYYRTLIDSYQIMEYEAVLKFIEKLLIFLLGIFILIKTKSVIALLIVFVVVYSLIFILHLITVNYKIKKILPKFNFKTWKYLFKHGMPFWFTWLFYSLFFRIDTIMLKYITSYSVVGWYNAAYKLIEGLSFIPSILIIVIFPAMSYLYKNNKQHLIELYRRSFKYLSTILLPLAIGITLLADRIILFLYKESFMHSALVMKILIWAGAFVFINYLIGNLLNSVNKQLLFTYSTGICIVLNIILNFILIPKFSYIGAGISTLISQIINFSLLYYFASSQGYSIDIIKTSIKPFIAALIMGIFIYLISQFHLLIIIPLAVIIYFAFLFLIKGVGKEELDMFRIFFQKNR